MKKLVLLDTDDFSEKIILNNTKRYSIFNAKHGFKIIFLLSFLLFSCIILFSLLFISNNQKHHLEIEKTLSYKDSVLTSIEKSELHYIIGYLYMQTNSVKPNKDTIYNFIKSCNVWYPEYIMAQASLESGFGNSVLAKNANNLFGMKAINQTGNHRPTTQIAGINYNGYGVYKSWELSIVDRILWELYKFKDIKPAEEDYIKAFNNYAESETYIQSLLLTAKKHKTN